MDGPRIITTVALCALLVSSADATEETIHFREGGGSGYTDVLFDDTWITYSPAADNTHGNDSYNGIKVSTSIASLIAVKDLFTGLPLTSGGCDIRINSATLYLFRYQGTLRPPGYEHGEPRLETTHFAKFVRLSANP